MDTNWFQQALAGCGLTQADLARHLGLAPSAVSRMIRGERRMTLQEAVETAAILGVSQDEVLRRAASETATPQLSSEPPRRGRPAGRTAPVFGRPQSEIPIRNISAMPTEGDQLAGYTPCPPNLVGVQGAYAVYMVGETLSPRYEPGWLLYVHPFKPPAKGRDVVVYKKDGTVLIRQFAGESGSELKLRQLNPEETSGLPREDVMACHLIVGVNQEG